MLERILHLSIARRWLILVATLAVAALGTYNYQRLPIDAVPDITNVQVQINTRGARLLAARSGAAHHVPDRDGDGRPAAARLHAVALPLRPLAGDRRVPGRHRHLLRAPARERAHPGGEEPAAAGHRAGDGADRDRSRRDLHVHRRERRDRRGLSGRSHPPMRVAYGAGLGDPPAAPARAGRRRGQHHRRLREAVSRDAGPCGPPRLRPDVARRHERARSEQRRTSAPATSSATASSISSASPGQVAGSTTSAASSLRQPGRGADPRAATSPTSCSARSCAPARRPRTVARSCSAPSSCSSARTAGRSPSASRAEDGGDQQHAAGGHRSRGRSTTGRIW